MSTPSKKIKMDPEVEEQQTGGQPGTSQSQPQAFTYDTCPSPEVPPFEEGEEEELAQLRVEEGLTSQEEEEPEGAITWPSDPDHWKLMLPPNHSK